MPPRPFTRRTVLRVAASTLAATTLVHRRADAADAGHPDRRWYLEARRMRALAESWGDQPYGAVVVVAGAVVGHGPSRVVRDGDPDAHAERVALREAGRAHAVRPLQGAVLYSTSRPCPACERAAAQAGIVRMYFGEDLRDAGPPRAASLLPVRQPPWS